MAAGIRWGAALAAMAAMALLGGAAVGCHRAQYNYKVAGAGAGAGPRTRASGLGQYRSVGIDVALADGVTSDAKDMDAFARELEALVRDTKVIPDVRAGTGDVELAVRVRVTKMEHKTHWSFMHGDGEWFEASADVEIYDIKRAASVERFSVDARPGKLFALPTEEERTLQGSVYTNVAHAIAKQIKLRR